MSRFRRFSAAAAVAALLPLSLGGAPPKKSAQPPRAAAKAAAEPWLETPLAADPAQLLAAAEARGADGEAFQILLEEARWTFDREGRSELRRRRVFRVLDVEGASDLDTVEAAWKPWKEARPELRARVVQKDGTVSWLDPKTVAERPVSTDPDIFDDRKELSAPLPALAPGAVVEWETVERETTPFPGGHLGGFTMGYTLPVGRFRVVVELPPDVPFTFKTYGLGDGMPKVTKRGASLLRTWDRVDAEPVDDLESETPPDVVQQPYLEFTTGTSWGDVAALYAQIVDGRLAPAAASAAARGGKTREEVAAAALAEVQRDVRYTSIAFGESAIVPEAPAKVLARRYGDCKDQATLLVGKLRARGVGADVALLRADGGRDVDAALPALSAFDHAIVRVAGEPPLFVDPTSPYHRVGELPSADQGRLALVCRKGVVSLERTPVASAAENRETTRLDVRLAADGPGALRETYEGTGDLGAGVRAQYDGVDADARKKRLQRAVADGYGGAELGAWEVSSPRDLTKPIRLSFDAAKAKVAQTSETDAGFALRRSVILQHLPAPFDESEDDGAPRPRRHDLAARPFRHDFVVRVTPPPGYVPRELPPAKTLSFGPGSLGWEASEENGAVVFKLFAELTATRLAPKDVAALKAARTEIGESDVVTIGFDHAAHAAAEAGRVKEAVALLRAAAARAPKDADPHRRLARVLLADGFGEAARREASKATALEPASARAWHRLGMALQHDLLGRLRKKGWDPAGAEKALAKAVALDGENLEYAADLALLLEHDAAGRRYQDAARLARAVEVWERILKKAPENRFALRQAATALLFAGRPADAVATLSKDEAGTAPATVVAAVGVKDGASAALAKARQLLPDAAARRAAVELAGANAFLLLRYDLAAAFFAEAARGGPRATELAQRAELARELAASEPREEAVRPADPESVVKTLFQWFLSPTAAPSAFERHLVKPARSRNAPDSLAKKRFFEEDAEVPETVTKRILASRLKLATSGDRSKGWKVRADLTAPGAPESEMTFYLAEEEGEARLVASSEGALTDLGRYAEHLARRGDLVGARSWLDRARDETSGAARNDRPLTSALFSRFWPADADADARSLLLAAAAAQLDAPVPEAPSAELLAELRTASRERPADRDRAALLFRALLVSKAWKEARDTARERAAAEPDLEDWTLGEVQALLGEKSYEEAARVASEHLAKHPDHLRVKRGLSDALVHGGRLDEGVAVADAIAASPEAIGPDFNQAAWFRLAAGKADDAAVALARRGVEKTGRRSYAVLNTLAALLAETGNGAEARDLVLEGLALGRRGEPLPADWYVLGRILESYDLPEDARAAYGRADDGDASPVGVGTLTARRLRGLGGAAPTPKKK